MARLRSLKGAKLVGRTKGHCLLVQSDRGFEEKLVWHRITIIISGLMKDRLWTVLSCCTGLTVGAFLRKARGHVEVNIDWHLECFINRTSSVSRLFCHFSSTFLSKYWKLLPEKLLQDEV